MSIEQERWRSVCGSEGRYEVSDCGRVRSLVRNKLLKASIDHSNGYARITISGTKYYVHRLVLEAFVGPCPEKHEACHCDGDRTNNCLDNLRWDTPQANQNDRAKHGTSNRGERQWQSKLTAEIAKAIVASREPSVTLARRYGVSPQSICDVRKGRKWAHATGVRSPA